MLNRLLQRAKYKAGKIGSSARDVADKFKAYVKQESPSWRKQAGDSVGHAKELAERAKDTAEVIAKSTTKGVADGAKGIYVDMTYSKERLARLQEDVENQGARYRELQRGRSTLDIVTLGGESMVTLLSNSHVPASIEDAYEVAFPTLSADVSFAERASQLDEERLVGLVSAVKGKLFEMEYVDYLNAGQLPDGYVAELADKANQAGWDIAITGPNQEIVHVLQAKATDSVAYVVDAMEKYPSIDVVTTDEVYGHLVMSGVSDGIAAGGFSNAQLTEVVESAAVAGDLSMDWMPPEATLALIAFTSYRDESLTLYEKSRNFGDRSGKVYLSYLIGGALAVATQTWWVGVLGAVYSRHMSDSGMRKVEVLAQLETTYAANREILGRMKALPAL